MYPMILMKDGHYLVVRSKSYNDRVTANLLILLLQVGTVHWWTKIARASQAASRNFENRPEQWPASAKAALKYQRTASVQKYRPKREGVEYLNVELGTSGRFCTNAQ